MRAEGPLGCRAAERMVWVMILVFLAEGFEEMEAAAPIDILRRAELEVKTVGVTGKQVTGSHGVTVTADLEISQVTTDEIEAVVLPGGMPGTLNLEKSPIVRACVEYAYRNGCLVAAICAAPSILGHMGILSGKRAVCFPGFEGELKGAALSEERVCVDGRIVTAKGAGAAVEFGLKLAELLADRETAERLKASMQCPQC